MSSWQIQAMKVKGAKLKDTGAYQKDKDHFQTQNISLAVYALFPSAIKCFTLPYLLLVFFPSSANSV